METKDLFNVSSDFLIDFEKSHRCLSSFIIQDDDHYLIIRWHFSEDFIYYTVTPKSDLIHPCYVTFYFLNLRALYHFTFKYKGYHTESWWRHKLSTSHFLSQYFVLRFLDNLTPKQRSAYVLGMRY